MEPSLQLFVFFFGAVFGSFTNAVIWRLRTGESFVFGRSYCPQCRHELSAWDLVPTLSYLLLRGRCRYCRKGIHPQYLIVELAMGLLFLAFARADLAAGFGGRQLMTMLAHWYFAVILTIVFIYDLRYMLILRSVTWPATVLAVLANLALGVPPWRVALGCLVGAGFFYLQYVLSRGRWIGGGDIHFGLLMGAMLAWPGTLMALMIAYIVGAFFGIILLLTKKKTMQSQLPFGTFLAGATLVMLLWGEGIARWYFGLLL
jgi:prepilin signal peptidase PulO-like enzyme (type II secretory pathway)